MTGVNDDARPAASHGPSATRPGGAGRRDEAPPGAAPHPPGNGPATPPEPAAAPPDGPAPGRPADRPLLEVTGLTKVFPGVRALDGVDFDLRPGEVHVLLGENGAGKSTLIKLLSGVHRPNGGRIRVDGREVEIRSTQDAERLGIATIHQEFTLVPGMTVAENVFLGRQPRTRLGLVDRRTMRRRAAGLLDRVGLDVPPEVPVAQLGIARLQMVEIAKALSMDARVLIMDEPTAVLTSEEVATLFALVRELRESGVGIIFITHHLEEIAALGDRVTVLRDGRSVAQVPAGTDREELIRLMVGRDVEDQYPRQRPETAGAPVLRVRGLSRRGPGGASVFEDVSFEVRAGEVVGLAGLVGAGRTEVARAVFGVDRPDEGSVEVDGQATLPGDVGAAIRAGLGLVPEDRKGQGLLPDASLGDNLTLARLRRDTRGGFVDRPGQRRRAAETAARLRVRMSGLDQPARTLSGGNQQKVVIGRWLLADTRLLILDEPTRGVDVGAKVEIYQLVNELTAAGRAVLMISSDLPEVLGMSDRVLVMAQGRLVGELSGEAATQDAVMELAVGARPVNEARSAVPPPAAAADDAPAAAPHRDREQERGEEPHSDREGGL
ncbi:sugar ABC transporter ATP-binding protein [Streptomyces sp. NPDC059740]|uniref:sugar ABC transporter ATP-binding protein n=1 Tax=Streptomyces sp. NPDC059740 TaxID=3346926 RepID=UPI0036625390